MQTQRLKDLCQLLAQQGLITPQQQASILDKADFHEQRLIKDQQSSNTNKARRGTQHDVLESDIIVSAGILNEEQITQALARGMGIPYVKIDPLKLDLHFVTQTISGPFAQKNLVMPLKSDGTILDVAVANPFDREILESLERITGLKVKAHLTPKTELLKILTEFYQFSSTINKAESKLNQGLDLGNLEQFVKLKSSKELEATDQPVITAVWQLFRYAFDQRASDIHIEPKRNYSEVRLRIDGALNPIHKLPNVVHRAVVSRVKMLSRMDIAEKRRPQDGRIKTEFDSREVELRVSTLPVAFGEKVVIRVFDPEVLMKDLPELGFFQRELDLFNDFIRRPHGMVLVTGPTGSGKTTTLYSALNSIHSPEINITTIEDPIEMVHESFNQIAVQPKVDVTFASALRTILRQDPDVIMVGEIRDGETAHHAIQAALTGHLILSTLHTNDSVLAINRLKDLGVPPFLVASTLAGIIAQRLLRRVCTECKHEKKLEPEQCTVLKLDSSKSYPVVYGKGCPKCRGTGYYGRISVYEILNITPQIAQLIHNQADISEIYKVAHQDGMINLRQGAIQHLLQGVTSFEEVIRTTYQ